MRRDIDMRRGLCVVAAVALGCTPASQDDPKPIPDAGLEDTRALLDAPGEAGPAGDQGSGTGDILPDMPAPSPEPPILERCPDAQAGSYLLIAYPDRVDAYRQRDFGATFFCRFLDLASNGITEATGIARSSANDGPFYVTVTRDGRGEVHSFDSDGAYIGRAESNINLAGITGIWPKFSGDGFVVWSQTNSNLYEIDDDAKFVSSYEPPGWQGSRVPNLTDLLFVRNDAVVATFSDRPPKVFVEPFAPDFAPEAIGASNAVIGVPTPEGTKLIITGEVGGAGNGYGVVLFKPIISGRIAPEQEAVLVAPGEFKDGVSILPLATGFLLLDSSIGGAAQLTSFDGNGDLQVLVTLDGQGNPYRLMRERVFPSL